MDCSVQWCLLLWEGPTITVNTWQPGFVGRICPEYGCRIAGSTSLPAYDTVTGGPGYSDIGDLDCPSCGTSPGSTHAVYRIPRFPDREWCSTLYHVQKCIYKLHRYFSCISWCLSIRMEYKMHHCEQTIKSHQQNSPYILVGTWDAGETSSGQCLNGSCEPLAAVSCCSCCCLDSSCFFLLCRCFVCFASSSRTSGCCCCCCRDWSSSSYQHVTTRHSQTSDSALVLQCHEVHYTTRH